MGTQKQIVKCLYKMVVEKKRIDAQGGVLIHTHQLGLSTNPIHVQTSRERDAQARTDEVTMLLLFLQYLKCERVMHVTSSNAMQARVIDASPPEQLLSPCRSRKR